MVEAVRQWGGALKFAAPALRGDPEIALSALATYAAGAEPLRDDRSLVLEFVGVVGQALCDASDRLRRDRALALAAVRNDPCALACADESLQGDPELAALAGRCDDD